MTLRKYLAMSLAAVSPLVLGQTSEQNTAVIVERHAFTSSERNDTAFLLPGQVVKVLSSRRELALVEDVDRPWVTSGGVWVPRKAVIKRASFKPLRKWRGEQHIAVVAGDYEAEYDLKSNGNFVYRSYDEKGNKFSVRGVLRKSGNIVWATPNHHREIRKDDIFVIMPSGHLCWPTPVEDCSAPSQ